MSPLRLNIQARLNALGLTQTELAKRTGLRRAEINEYVTGERDFVSFATLELLAKHLKVRPARALIVDASEASDPPGAGRPPKPRPSPPG